MSDRKMNRRNFLRTAGGTVTVAAAGCMASSTTAAKAESKPNIIMIFADDLDFDEIGVYNILKYPCCTGAKELGYCKDTKSRRYYHDKRMLTPHIDKLARDGATLARFYITSAICTPSRYAVLTGRFASRSPGFCKRFPPGTQASIRWNTPLEPAETNVAKAMKANGYATGMVGKWHSGGPPHRVKGLAKDADPSDPKVQAKIRSAYEPGLRYLRENFGFDYVDRIYMGNKEPLGLPYKMKVHNLEWFTDGALEFIDRYHKRPFFFYMPLTTPHGQYGTRFLTADPRYTPAGVLEKAPEVQPSRQSIVERLAAAGIDKRNAMATWIDDALGAILEKLDNLGIADNTVVIFTSDHQSRGKFTCYEGARVPFIIRWPGKIKPGSRIDAVCANVDLAPTFIRMAGGTPQQDMARDGESFLPMLLGQGTPRSWRNGLLLECSNIRAVVTERWKYIANRPPKAVREQMEAEARQHATTGKKRRIGWDGSKNPHTWEKGIRYGADLDFPCYFDDDQLYDLAADPFEQKNLANDPAWARTLEEMKALLKAKLKDLPHTFGEFKTS